MSRINFIFAIAILTVVYFVNPQNLYSQVYQFDNPGFEQWDGGSADEPTGWNSYPSANCTILVGCSTAKQKKHEKSTDAHSGNYSCKIYAKSVLGVIANGALTSGQMELGSLSMSSNANGNRTIISNDNFNQKLNAKPDSIVFWAKAVNASNSSLSCCHLYIHDSYELKDPLAGNNGNEYLAHIVGKVPSYDFTNEGSNWKRHSTPIEYDGCQSNDPQYILITFSTNKNAGEGSNGDALYIDDIELIYNANLSSITVNGTEIPNFNQNTTDYYVNVECGSTNYISATTASPRASYSTSLSADGNTATITVNHGDKTKKYYVHYNSATTYPITDQICKGDSYSQNGFVIPTQNNAGSYLFSNTFPSANGCDSVVELTLNVYSDYTKNLDLTICESATYDFFGQTISEAGTYQHLLTSQYGCDSTIVLNLLVDSYYQTNINAHICDGEVYHEDGFDRVDAGIDTLRLVAQNSCDSIIVLHLEVGRIDNVELQDSVVAETAYSNYGFDIEAITDEGVYTFTNTLSNAEGCDSIVTLTLKVIPKTIVNPDPESDPVPDVVTFDVFPSPTANGKITIRGNYEIINEKYDYQIFNIQGKLMDEGTISSRNTTVDITNYNSGYYFLKVLIGTKKEQKRKAIKFMVTE